MVSITKYNHMDHLGMVFELHSTEIFRFVTILENLQVELSLGAERSDSGSVFDIVEL